MVLNIVSMIDVIFLLMTYFLLTAKFATREESFEVRVPEALEGAASATPPADPFDLPATAIELLVTSRGDGVDDFAVFCDSPALGEGMAKGGAITSYDALAARAGAARGGVLGDDQRFIVLPAADARWEHALGVLNAVKRAGYNNVRFAAPARAGDPGEP
jgi:biopolymer transport protein ExbD